MEGVSAVFGVAAGCTTAIGAIKTLWETLARYRDRNTALQRLKSLLQDLEAILTSLQCASQTIESISALLQGPIENCSQMCTDLKTTIDKFDPKSKSKSNSKLGSRSNMTIIDWGRMEFSRGTLSDGLDILDGYKSTIQLGLIIINLFAPLSP